jgi:hypothetical protein
MRDLADKRRPQKPKRADMLWYMPLTHKFLLLV